MTTNNRVLLGTMAVAALFIIALSGLYFWHFRSLSIANNIPFELSSNHAVWGTFGDYIGGVIGTICNLLGVSLLYLTFKAQMTNSNLQQFETTFFNLLANQREIVRGLSGELSSHWTAWQPETFSGDAYLEKASDELAGYMYEFSVMRNGDTVLPVDEILHGIDKVYNDFYKGKEAELDHYFRHLYHIVKYTDEAPITNRRKYVDIIQAQMSDKELLLAFYNGIALYGRNRFMPLMDKYGFIENVRSRGGTFNMLKKIFYPNNK